MRHSKLTGAMISAALLWAAPADAAIYKLTFDGLVTVGFDLAGVFGNGIDLSNRTFSLSFSFDHPSRNVLVTTDLVKGVETTQVHAGYSDVILTIGGRAVSMGSNDVDYERYASLLNDRRGISVDSTYVVGDRTGRTESRVSANLSSILTPFFGQATAFAPIDYTINDGDDVRGFGSFGIVRYTPPGVSTPQALGNFQVRRVQLVEVVDEAVPEPATWAMMLAGFGAVGAAVRRKPCKRATAY